jgi:urease accessory protein UreH
MRPDDHAEQHVRIAAARGATVQYYPLPAIPFPDSELVQTLTIDADPAARVGVLETLAMGRVARDEYLAFRALSSRTTLRVDGEPVYVDATELRPREGASRDDLLIAFAQSRPGLVYLRALASDAPSLDAALRRTTARVAAAWGQDPVSLDRFRC